MGDAGGGEAVPAASCEVSVEEGLFSLWTVGMTNVYCLVTPKRVLGNIDSVVPDLLNGTSNESGPRSLLQVQDTKGDRREGGLKMLCVIPLAA